MHENENELIAWWKTAQKLAVEWAPSMNFRACAKIDAEAICDCLVDLWMSKGGGDEFAETNRGMLYNYVLATLEYSRDAGMYACSAADPAGYDDDGIDEDADDDFDPVERFEKAVMREELGERLDEIEAIWDTWLSGALAEVFETTRRSGRTFAGEIRREKMLPAIMSAAKKRGVTAREVKALAAGIAAERRRSLDRINAPGAAYAEIEAFEQMMGIGAATVTATATSKMEKTRSRPAKSRRKSAPEMPMVPQPQQQPIQMELV